LLVLKQISVLDPRLLALLADAGHMDLIVIADAGLPIPPGVELIDLSLVSGVPSVLQVFDAVRGLLVVQEAILAQELRDQPLFSALPSRLEGVPLEEVWHESFKLRTVQALGIIRTGECAPYANIGLVAGVAF
jgi:D-ribose pyranase